MALAVGLQELAEVEMNVFLRGGQAFMAQQLLNDPQVRPPAEKMRGEGMPE